MATTKGTTMKTFVARKAAGAREQAGKIGWILLWALGVPIPILLVLFLLRGCT
jgi:hypothetical protein